MSTAKRENLLSKEIARRLTEEKVTGLLINVFGVKLPDEKPYKETAAVKHDFPLSVESTAATSNK